MVVCGGSELLDTSNTGSDMKGNRYLAEMKLGSVETSVPER